VLCSKQHREVLVFVQGDIPQAQFEGRNDPLQEDPPILGLQQPAVALTENQALESDLPREFAVPSLEGFAQLTGRVSDS
jgi:hypothetical protein